MDLDFVTLKPFDTDIFWNFVSEEDDGVLTGSSFHFQKDHPIVRRMMIYLASSYHPNEWSYSVIGRIMIRINDSNQFK
jgi:lactosylceramide 4-alpha-galactosyltransferase